MSRRDFRTPAARRSATAGCPARPSAAASPEHAGRPRRAGCGRPCSQVSRNDDEPEHAAPLIEPPICRACIDHRRDGPPPGGPSRGRNRATTRPKPHADQDQHGSTRGVGGVDADLPGQRAMPTRPHHAASGMGTAAGFRCHDGVPCRRRDRFASDHAEPARALVDGTARAAPAAGRSPLRPWSRTVTASSPGGSGGHAGADRRRSRPGPRTGTRTTSAVEHLGQEPAEQQADGAPAPAIARRRHAGRPGRCTWLRHATRAPDERPQRTRRQVAELGARAAVDRRRPRRAGRAGAAGARTTCAGDLSSDERDADAGLGARGFVGPRPGRALPAPPRRRAAVPRAPARPRARRLRARGRAAAPGRGRDVDRPSPADALGPHKADACVNFACPRRDGPRLRLARRRLRLRRQRLGAAAAREGLLASACSSAGGGSRTTTSRARRGTCGATSGRRGSGCAGSSGSRSFKDVAIVSGAGVGGGSLGYANTLYRARAALLRGPAVGRAGRLGDRARAALRRPPSGCSASSPTTRTTRPTTCCASSRARSASRTRTPRRASACSLGGRRGETVPDPYFGGAGPGPHGLRALRALHDRLPASAPRTRW